MTDGWQRLEAAREWLAMIRALPRLQVLLLVIGVGLGLFVALEHWVGLALAGVVIGLVSTTLRQAIAIAVLTALLVAGAMLGYAARHDQLGILAAMGDFTVIAVAMAFGLLILGALVRAVV